MSKQMSVELVRQRLNNSSSTMVEKMEYLLRLLEELRNSLCMEDDQILYTLAVDRAIAILGEESGNIKELQDSLVELDNQEIFPIAWEKYAQEENSYEVLAVWAGEKIESTIQTSFLLEDTTKLSQYLSSFLDNFEGFVPTLGPTWKTYFTEFLQRSISGFNTKINILTNSSHPESSQLSTYYEDAKEILNSRFSHSKA